MNTKYSSSDRGRPAADRASDRASDRGRPAADSAVFVKICGITSPADGRAAVAAGTDAIGVNFFAASPRRVDVAQASAIAAAVRAEDPDVLVVGVFRDHLADEVIEIAGQVGLDAAQLHGQETPLTCREVRAQVPLLIRAFAAGDPQLATIEAHVPDIVLLDAPTPGGGVPFDWGLVGDVGHRYRLLLAGGLRPDTVADAVAQVRPWGVDVASGVERSPGVKDHDAMAVFTERARTAGAAYPAPHPPVVPQGNHS